MNGERLLFTVGHSNHSFEEFLALLKRHGVTAVADVRSQPYGRLDHFHRENLEASLKASDIAYVFLGRELGARREEPECYVDDQARYDRIPALPGFRSGIERVEQGSATHVIALMCAEKDPLDCHRMILVSRELARLGWRIAHILSDGALESQEDAEERLVRRMGVERTLFEPELTYEDLVERAYERRAEEIAYRAEHVGAVE